MVGKAIQSERDMVVGERQEEQGKLIKPQSFSHQMPSIFIVIKVFLKC